jgi:uncharacterized protein (DUF488 family)
MKAIFTIGYEGANIDQFVNTLQANKIDILLDVREFPISRKKGFSKSALREAVEQKGISYRHERALGSPKPIRSKLYADGNYKAFFSAFGRHLKTQESLLACLVEECRGKVALVCFERDVATCHRRLVAEAFGELSGAKLQHLIVTENRSQRNAAATNNNTCLYIGESLSAA